MPVKGKRPAPPSSREVPSKKHKGGHGKKPVVPNNRSGRKEKASERKYITLPTVKTTHEEEEITMSDQDVDVLQNASFLRNLDEKGIAKSKKELERLHKLYRPARTGRSIDDLPAVNSGSEEYSDTESLQSGGFSDELFEDAPISEDEEVYSAVGFDSDTEMPYEQVPRKQHSRDRVSTRTKQIEGLPIKLPDGTIQKSTKMLLVTDSELSSNEESEGESVPRESETRVEDITTGARFGRAAVVDIVGKSSRKERVEAAKEQIASICQEILADPENSLGLLRRLHTFSLLEISTPTRPKPIPNDPVIRKLTFLSQLTVFKDIIPGYRIRPLSDKEKAEKVSSMVARTREWEQGLVAVYQAYLRSLEAEIKERSVLADVALSCMCTLLAEATHFNFSTNLISCIIARLSRKSWDKSSGLCIKTIIKVFRDDLTGHPSLEIVRMLNRMVKERNFAIHPNVLSCLMHLRLRTELGVRASNTKVEKDGSRDQDQHPRKGKKAKHLHLSKKTRKVLKEKKEIEQEMREAAAEIDREERAATHTETLKLLFALYFRVLKNPRPSPLLSATLTGIAKFAHLVNIDFFQDLLQVLKNLISLEFFSDAVQESREDFIRYRLQCIVTAFDLLSGQGGNMPRSLLICLLTQCPSLLTLINRLLRSTHACVSTVSFSGEALNIDLTDFITQLYEMILPLTMMNAIESKTDPIARIFPSAHISSNSSRLEVDNNTLQASIPSQATISPPSSISDLLFSALQAVFSLRAGAGTAPPWRSAAFAKRLLLAALHWPPESALRALHLIHDLIAKNPKVEALLSTEDRAFDGIYRPDVDDPQLCHPYGTAFWELQTLAMSHMDPTVRASANKLLRFRVTS